MRRAINGRRINNLFSYIVCMLGMYDPHLYFSPGSPGFTVRAFFRLSFPGLTCMYVQITKHVFWVAAAAFAAKSERPARSVSWIEPVDLELLLR